MATKIHRHTNPRVAVRAHRKSRIRRKLAQMRQKPIRLVVFRSNKFMYAQLIDDAKGITLAQANTREAAFNGKSSKKNTEIAAELGKLIGQRALEQKVEKIFFDRNGYNYHGRVKALADGAREAGLRF